MNRIFLALCLLPSSSLIAKDPFVVLSDSSSSANDNLIAAREEHQFIIHGPEYVAFESPSSKKKQKSKKIAFAKKETERTQKIEEPLEEDIDEEPVALAQARPTAPKRDLAATAKSQMAPVKKALSKAVEKGQHPIAKAPVVSPETTVKRAIGRVVEKSAEPVKKAMGKVQHPIAKAPVDSSETTVKKAIGRVVEKSAEPVKKVLGKVVEKSQHPIAKAPVVSPETTVKKAIGRVIEKSAEPVKKAMDKVQQPIAKAPVVNPETTVKRAIGRVVGKSAEPVKKAMDKVQHPIAKAPVVNPETTVKRAIGRFVEKSAEPVKKAMGKVQHPIAKAPVDSSETTVKKAIGKVVEKSSDPVKKALGKVIDKGQHPLARAPIESSEPTVKKSLGKVVEKSSRPIQKVLSTVAEKGRSPIKMASNPKTYSAKRVLASLTEKSLNPLKQVTSFIAQKTRSPVRRRPLAVEEEISVKKALSLLADKSIHPVKQVFAMIARKSLYSAKKALALIFYKSTHPVKKRLGEEAPASVKKSIFTIAQKNLIPVQKTVVAMAEKSRHPLKQALAVVAYKSSNPLKKRTPAVKTSIPTMLAKMGEEGWNSFQKTVVAIFQKGVYPVKVAFSEIAKKRLNILKMRFGALAENWSKTNEELSEPVLSPLAVEDEGMEEKSANSIQVGEEIPLAVDEETESYGLQMFPFAILDKEESSTTPTDEEEEKEAYCMQMLPLEILPGVETDMGGEKEAYCMQMLPLEILPGVETDMEGEKEAYCMQMLPLELLPSVETDVNGEKETYCMQMLPLEVLHEEIVPRTPYSAQESPFGIIPLDTNEHVARRSKGNKSRNSPELSKGEIQGAYSWSDGDVEEDNGNYPYPAMGTCCDFSSLWPKRIDIRHVLGYQENSCLPFASNYTSVDLLFAPNYCLYSVMPMLDLRGHRFDNNTYAANAGIGGRFIYQDCCGNCDIFGLNAFYDYRQGCIGYFQQVGVGIEVLMCRWELHANAYAPFGHKYYVRSCLYDNYEGDYWMIRRNIESVSYSFNGEVGYYPFCRCDWLVYIGVGPYFLVGNRCSKNHPGVEARIRPQYKDYFAVDLSYRYDDLFGSIFQAEFVFSLPLYQLSSCQNYAPCCNISDQRMYQPIQRFEVLPLSSRTCWLSNF